MVEAESGMFGDMFLQALEEETQTFEFTSDLGTILL